MNSRDKNINFYTLPKFKKFCPKIVDGQVKYTGCPLFEHMLFCGKTKSGKTQSLNNYIERCSRDGGTYKKIFMLAKKMDENNRFLMAELEDKFEIFFDINSFPSVKDFPDLTPKNSDKWLVIFDDCVNDKDRNTEKKINEYFTFGRARGITCVFLTQAYYQTNIFIRKQVSWVFLCGINSNKDLKSILKEYAIGDVDDEQMKKMYEFCKEEDEPNEINFMKICTYHCPLNKKFSRNWLDYLNPNDFPSSKLKKRTTRFEIDSDSDSN